MRIAQDELKLLAIFTEAVHAEESGNVAKAMRLYKVAGKKGYTPALINLGSIYDDVVKPPQPEKAIAAYKRAVKLAHPAAAVCLAIHHKNLQNRRWYKYWLQKAADMGDEDAMDELTKLKKGDTKLRSDPNKKQARSNGVRHR